MHHIYTTKAIIIKSVPIGEANKYYFLLTEDLGFVKASAQGVRLGKSKLKGHLQDFCKVSVSLVKGKSIWRITSVETIRSENFLAQTNGSTLLTSGKMIAIKNIFSLLLRLLHGEEKNEWLFKSVESTYDFLLDNKLNLERIKNLETITVLRILYHLGYFKESSPAHKAGAPTGSVGAELIDFVKDDGLSIDMLGSFENHKKLAILDINNVLNETHL